MHGFNMEEYSSEDEFGLKSATASEYSDDSDKPIVFSDDEGSDNEEAVRQQTRILDSLQRIHDAGGLTPVQKLLKKN